MNRRKLCELALHGLSLVFLQPVEVDASTSPSLSRPASAIVRSVTPPSTESWLAREVRHELSLLPEYTVFDHLAFKVDGPKVTLSGRVTRPALKQEAERAVKAIAGIEAIENQVEVLPASPAGDQIRWAAYREIYGHPALSRYAEQTVPPIHLIVSQGRLTLEGTVVSEADRVLAKVQASQVPGVLVVEDHLSVAP